MPRQSFNPSGSLPAIALSQRLMKMDATEWTAGLRPALIRRSIPRMKAPAAFKYWSREKSKVTLTGIPANMASSIAERPFGVPGILMNRFGRSAEAHNCFAALRVFAGSSARSGDNLQRHPAVHAIRGIVNGPEQVGCLCEIV